MHIPTEIYYIISSTILTFLTVITGLVLMNLGCNNNIGSPCPSNCTTDGYTIKEGACSNNVSCFNLENLCNTTLLHMSTICQNVTANDIIVFDESDCDSDNILAQNRMAIIGLIMLIIGAIFMFGSGVLEAYRLHKKRPSYEPINHQSYATYGSV